MMISIDQKQQHLRGLVGQLFCLPRQSRVQQATLIAGMLSLVSLAAVGEAQAQQVRASTFEPSTQMGTPQERAGAGTRGDCESTEMPLTALVPEVGEGITTTGSPTILVYVPLTQAQEAEFLLVDLDNGERVHYETTLPIAQKPGIVSIQLPKQSETSPLQPETNYRWIFSILHNPSDRSGNPLVQGVIRWVLPDRARSESPQSSLVAASPLAAGIDHTRDSWYDRLAGLTELRREDPDNQEVFASWEHLLQSAALEPFIAAPLLSHYQLLTGGEVIVKPDVTPGAPAWMCSDP